MQHRIKKNVSLKEFTTFRLGGPAEFFLEASTEEELKQGIAYAKNLKIPWFVLGGGSNLVVSDEGMEGLVILNKASDVEVFEPDQSLLTISSGRKLRDVVLLAQQKGLCGLEVLSGIPGSFGGAIYGNAGAYGCSIGNLIAKATVLFPDGSVKIVPNSFFNFSYRTSVLKSVPHVVLNATIKLERGDSHQILHRMQEIFSQREGKHPPRDVGSAGSFFQNLPPLPGDYRRRAAGKILEEVGAKNLRWGGASVYEKHANFIVNYGEATAKDVMELASILKKTVQEIYSIELQEEVSYVGRS